ncbi:MAG: hypothetical protein LBI39_00050 [Puniceicoccales bacterium]|jgi:hypothetical protein|nr:hypothetical protein [Puniceicoccales bacterium]
MGYRHFLNGTNATAMVANEATLHNLTCHFADEVLAKKYGAVGAFRDTFSPETRFSWGSRLGCSGAG